EADLHGHEGHDRQRRHSRRRREDSSRRAQRAVAGERTNHSAEVVIPGMIDAHSHMALDRLGSGAPGPITSEWKARDHFDPKNPMIQAALSGGVTSLITRSGSGIISSGQSVAIKLRSDPTRNMILKPYVDLKMAVRPLINVRP